MTQILEPPTRSPATVPSTGPNAGTEQLTMVAALNRALRDAMHAERKVLVFGTDVGVQGGCSG